MLGEEQNGRWYATYGEHFYHFPIDTRERMREALMEHRLYTFILSGRLLLVPVEKAGNDVLDIGTGSGAWAVHFADTYPSSLVHGRDLNIKKTWSATNCIFEIDDCEMPWGRHERYDIIHIRSMTAGIRNWTHLFAQCFAHLRVGGCIEVQDFDFRVECDD
jgi:trans-aconitate methyltransferase